MTKSPLSRSSTLLSVSLLALSGCNDGKTSTAPEINLPEIVNLAPVVSSVTIVPPTQPGENITGKYVYSDDWDAEGNSLFIWLIDDVQVAEGVSFTLPSDSEGKKLSFCVTPIAKTGALEGTQRCSFALIVGEYNKPAIKSLTLSSPITTETEISASYSFVDERNRAEGESSYSWKIDNTELSTSARITLAKEQQGNLLSLCITPIAVSGENATGDEVCSDEVLIAAKVGSAPVASELQLFNLIEATNLISTSYEYFDDDGDAQADSSFSWSLNGSEVSQQENFTLPIESAGKLLQVCVTPNAQTGTPAQGAQLCSDEILVAEKLGSAPTATNVQFVNFAEAGNELSIAYDYFDIDTDAEASSTITWFIDGVELSQQPSYTLPNDSAGKLLKACVVPFAQTGIPFEGSESCVEENIADIVITGELELNQTITLDIIGYSYDEVNWKITHPSYPYIRSYDSNSFTITGLTPTEDAIWLVGYDVEVCVDTIESGEICLLASEQPTDEITGGIPVELDGDNNITKRVVSPVSFIDLTISGVTKRLHRPLSTTESTLLNISSGGSVPIHSSEFNDVNVNITWAMYDWPTASDSCTNQGKVLPVDGVNDVSDGFGLEQYYNQVVSDYAQFPYSHFRSALGWPAKYFWTASLHSADNHYDYYLISGSASWIGDSTIEAVSCLSTLP